MELRRLHHHHDGPAHADGKGGSGSGIGNESESEDEENKTMPTRRIRRVGTLSKEYTDEEEKAVLRKLDRKLVLFLGFLYMLSFLDRSNIGE